ncbi:MAG: Ig-like domain-containing protein [Coriobacteriia bacterium]|nr:Ig-like domain-containing protein [Coriobacteriia bacterium]
MRITMKLTAASAGLLLAASLLPAAALTALCQVEPAMAATAPTLALTRVNTGMLCTIKGHTYEIGAKATSGSSIRYYTSNSKVATVSTKGTIRAKAYGGAVITVEAKKSGKVTTKKIRLSVTSVRKYVNVKSVYAKMKSQNLTVGQTTKVVTTFRPTKPSNRNVTFKSLNPDIATVTSYGTVKAKKVGKATIRVTSCANKDKTRTVNVYVKSGSQTTPTPTPPEDPEPGVPPVRSQLDDYSWAELSDISEMISQAPDLDAAREIGIRYHLLSSAGKILPNSYKRVTVTCLDANGRNFRATCHVRIIGLRDDIVDSADYKLAGLTFEFKQIIACKRMNPDGVFSGGWASSELRAWLNADNGLLPRLPADLVQAVVKARKCTNNTGALENYFQKDFSGGSIVSRKGDYFFLPAFTELYSWCPGTSNRAKAFNAESDQYTLYKELGVNYDDNCTLLCKYLVGQSSQNMEYWLRTPEACFRNCFSSVLEDSGYWGTCIIDEVIGVSPCFCI